MVLNGEIYAIGGSNARDVVVNNVEVFEGSKWKTGPSLHTARRHFGATSFGGKIWVAGGEDATSKNFDSVEVFDGKRWTAGPSLVTAARGLVLVSFGARGCGVSICMEPSIKQWW